MLGFMTIVSRGRKEAGNLKGALVLQLALATGKGTTRNDGYYNLDNDWCGSN